MMVGAGIDPVGDAVVGALGRYGTLEVIAAQMGWSARDRQLVHLVDGHGFTITEAARRLGIARETANRRLVQIHRQARQVGAENFAVVA